MNDFFTINSMLLSSITTLLLAITTTTTVMTMTQPAKNASLIASALKEEVVTSSKVPQKEPDPTTVEKEKVISEETKLNWNNSGMNGAFISLNSNDFYIYYDNLEYKVEHIYEDVQEKVVETFGGNEKGKVINTYKEKAIKGYKLDRVENLPLTISENQSENVIRVYYKKEKCNIIFKPNNGQADVEMTLKYGDELVTPEPAPKEGYTFDSWINVSDPNKPDEIVYVAKWNVNQYTITYVVDGQQQGEVETYNYGTQVTMRPENLQKEGHTFVGWDTTLPSTMPAENIVVNGTFKVNTYKVTYKVDGELYGDVEKYDYGQVVTPKSDPVKEGHTFIGWDKPIVSPMPAGDMIYEAQWKVNQYTITYKVDGEINGEVESHDYGASITEKEGPSKEGYTFVKWDVELPETMPAENIELNAIYSVNSYTITYKVDGKTYGSVEKYEFGEKIVTKKEPSKEGYTFTGWDVAIPTTMPANDIVANAKFNVNSYTITYKVDGKTYGDVDKYNYGEKVTERTAPSKEGYTFIGWDNLIPSTMPAKNIVTNAVYAVNSYTITYKVDGKTYGSVEEYEYGEKITVKKAPSKEGYTFIGWEPSVPSTMSASNIVVNAKFTINSYTITYKVDGKTYGDVEEYDYGQTITIRNEPTKDGYIFSGWDKKLPAKMPAENIIVSGTFKAQPDAVLKMSKTALKNGSEINNYIFNPDSTNTFTYRLKVWNTVENSKAVGTKTVTDTLPLGIKVNGSLPSGVTKTTSKDREVLTWKVSNIGYGEANAAQVDIPVVIEQSIFVEQSVDSSDGGRTILDVISTQDSSRDKYVNSNNQDISGWNSSERVSDTSRKKVNLYIRGVGNTSASSNSGYIFAGSVQLGTSGLSANRVYASNSYQETQINNAINSGNIANMLDAFVTANENGTMSKYIYGGLPSEATVNANLRNLYKDSKGYPVFQLSDTQVVLWYCINSNVNDRLKRYYDIKDGGTKIFSDYVLIPETTYHMDGIVVDISSLGSKIPAGVSVDIENVAKLDDLSAKDVITIYYKNM